MELQRDAYTLPESCHQFGCSGVSQSIKGRVTEAMEAALDSLEQNVRDNAAPPEGFALAMWKIRSITKVPSIVIWTHEMSITHFSFLCYRC
jgi:hypothetical protein